MERNLKSASAFLAVSVLSISSAFANCDTGKYRQVFSSCLMGRASDTLELPSNDAFGSYPGEYTESWNLGAHTSAYAGTAFDPTTGPSFDPKTSILPPYNWGAVGQICDPTYDPKTHDQCVSDLSKKLSDPKLNAQSSSGEFYWKAHGHNCHDAAEDVGFCVYQAEKAMPAECPMDVRVLVWDDEADITKALGNVYHSQLLVKRVIDDATTHTQHEAVCLVESQVTNPSGDFDFANCCTTNMNIFASASGQDYSDAFGKCNQLLTLGQNPHTYDLLTFRADRKTGAMDMDDAYDRQAGLKALHSPKKSFIDAPLVTPKIVSGVYSTTGTAIMLKVK